MIKELALIFQIPILMGGWNGHPPILLNNVKSELTSTIVNITINNTDTMVNGGSYTTSGKISEDTYGTVNTKFSRTFSYQLGNEYVYDYYTQVQCATLKLQDGEYYSNNEYLTATMIEFHKIVVPSNYGININDLTYTEKLNFYSTYEDEESFLADHYTYITSNQAMDGYITKSIKTQSFWPRMTFEEILDYENYSLYEQRGIATETAQVETTEYYSNYNTLYLIEYSVLEPQETMGYDMNNVYAFDSVQYKAIELNVWEKYEITTSEDYATDIENGNFMSVWSLMLNILTLPFAFISQAVNITLWPGTVASINIGTMIMSILGAIILIMLIKLIVGKFK